jgi:HlyD family secretion protein
MTNETAVSANVPENKESPSPVPTAQSEAAIPGAEEKAALAVMRARTIILTGSALITVFVIGFIVWAALAPLHSAAMAPGLIVVESHRKAIQHFEGGIVRNVLVTEGQVVEADQDLIVLDNTRAKTELAMIQGEADALTALEARLVAERDGLETITFPPTLLSRIADTKVAEAIQGQVSAFASRRETLTKQTEIFSSRTEQNDKIIAGLMAQQESLDKQIKLIDKERQAAQAMVKKGLERVPRLLALQRQAAELTGQRGQVVEQMARVQLNSSETQLQIINLRNERRDEVLKELRDVQTRRFDLLDRIHTAEATLNRTTLKAPVSGRVVALSVHTNGAVVRPGETLLEVVPNNDELEIEARVLPEDIDDVVVGMPATVTLTGYQQRRLPLVSGTVTNVSADRLMDQATGQPFFRAQIRVDKSSWDDFPEVKLVPGMPVEVSIATGSRTALEYFVAPVQSVLRRGMREK